jgi:hypothetical protein
VAQWLDQVHSDMYNATMQMAQMQATYAGNYASLGSSLLNEQTQAQLGVAKEALGAQQQLGSQAFQFQSGLAAQGYQTQSQLAQQQFNLAAQLQQWAVKQQAAIAEAQQKFDYENANLNLRAQSLQSLDAYRQAEIGVRDAMAQIAAARLDRSGGGSGTGATPSDTRMAGAVGALQSMASGLVNLYTQSPDQFTQQYPNASNPQDVIDQYIATHSSDYLSQGVSPTSLKTIMDSYFTANSGASSAQPQGSQSDTQSNSMPWWQSFLSSFNPAWKNAQWWPSQ